MRVGLQPYSCLQELDRKTSIQVQKMFEVIDGILFEHNQGGQHHLQAECKDWGENFPHLRYISFRLFQTRHQPTKLAPALHGCDLFAG